MTTPRGAARGYGFGLYLTTTAWGARGIYHLGGIIGFSAQNVWFPAESLSVTILYNSIGDGFPTNFILAVARAISATAPQAAEPSTPPSAVIGSIAPANLTLDRTIGAVVGIVKGADATTPLFWLAGTHHSSPQQAARRRFAPPAGRVMASPTPRMRRCASL